MLGQRDKGTSHVAVGFSLSLTLLFRGTKTWTVIEPILSSVPQTKPLGTMIYCYIYYIVIVDSASVRPYSAWREGQRLLIKKGGAIVFVVKHTHKIKFHIEHGDRNARTH